MKGPRRQRPAKPRTSPSVLEHLNPNVAGIDCGSAEHFVAVVEQPLLRLSLAFGNLPHIRCTRALSKIW